MKKTYKVQTNNIFEISSPTNKVKFCRYFYCSQDWYQTPNFRLPPPKASCKVVFFKELTNKSKKNLRKLIKYKLIKILEYVKLITHN